MPTFYGTCMRVSPFKLHSRLNKYLVVFACSRIRILPTAASSPLNTQRRATQDYVTGSKFWIASGYCSAIINGESIHQHWMYVDFVVSDGVNEPPMSLLNLQPKWRRFSCTCNCDSELCLKASK